MGAVSDFLFGKKVLKQAAQGTPAPAPSTPSQPSGIDMAAEAQKAADRAKAQKAGPLATPMTPQTKMGPPKAKQ